MYWTIKDKPSCDATEAEVTKQNHPESTHTHSNSTNQCENQTEKGITLRIYYLAALIPCAALQISEITLCSQCCWNTCFPFSYRWHCSLLKLEHHHPNQEISSSSTGRLQPMNMSFSLWATTLNTTLTLTIRTQLIWFRFCLFLADRSKWIQGQEQPEWNSHVVNAKRQ